MSSKARGGLKVALALGRYAALRSEILVKLLWSEYDGTAIECRVHNNEKWRQEVCPELKAILDETPRKADTIVTSELGRPYTLAAVANYREIFVDVPPPEELADVLNIAIKRSARRPIS
jgi:hypothetical protein